MEKLWVAAFIGRPERLPILSAHSTRMHAIGISPVGGAVRIIPSRGYELEKYDAWASSAAKRMSQIPLNMTSIKVVVCSKN